MILTSWNWFQPPQHNRFQAQQNRFLHYWNRFQPPHNMFNFFLQAVQNWFQLWEIWFSNSHHGCLCKTKKKNKISRKVVELTIKDMFLSTMNKFSRYWNNYFDIFAIGIILDSCMKFEAIWFCYSKINHSICKEKINVLKHNMYKLFEKCVKLNSNKSNIKSPSFSSNTTSFFY